jgi:hypothetical protein
MLTTREVAKIGIHIQRMLLWLVVGKSNTSSTHWFIARSCLSGPQWLFAFYHEKFMAPIAFSPDRLILATGSGNQVPLRNVSTGERR